MQSTNTLIVGAGISGLAAAAALGESGDEDYLVLEADTSIGGYCKTVKQAGFTWDYSGHFFHFRNPEIEAWLRARMPEQQIMTVCKRAFIAYKGKFVDFPFQKNIHQLEKGEFIDCLHDLYFASIESERRGAPSEPMASNFKAMLFSRFGRAIAEKFLVPYNEKLYATDLSRLDPDAMGRFFPNANLSEVMRQLKAPDNASYNSTFTYPEGGAIQFVNALASAVIAPKISLNEVLLKVDPKRRVAQTSKREIRFERLISSAPFNRLLGILGLEVTPGTWTSNKVFVFNLGFDRKGQRDVHWIYYPDPDCVFYRVGFYDNIFDTDRLSTYVEIGLPTQVTTDPEFIERTRKRVLEDMRRHGIIQDHELVAEHHVVMDPAYVHLTGQSIAEHSRLCSALNTQGIYSIGRYGGWTYCSIEDNIVEARRLVSHLNS